MPDFLGGTMKVQAVLFDCDGLMFNTERISDHLWNETAQTFGIKRLPDEFFKAITGAKDEEVIERFYQEIPHLKDMQEIMNHKRFDLDFWASFYPDGLNKKGLIPLVLYLEKERISHIICSSSSKRYVETLIHTVSVPLHFDGIIGGDSIVHGKPDPEIFLKGAELLNKSPVNCLVLEDSKQGIIAAKRAGMHRCFIPDTIVPDEEMRNAIEFQCADLSEVIDLIQKNR